ncbi:MAG: TonB family protein [Pseudomonadota bacterium]
MSASLAWSPSPPRRLPLLAGLTIAALLHAIALAQFLTRAPAPDKPAPAPPLPILEIDLTPREDSTPPERPEMLAEHTQRADQGAAARAPELAPTLNPKPDQTIPAPTPAAPQATPPQPTSKTASPAEARSVATPRRQPPKAQHKAAEQAAKPVEQSAAQETLSMTELGLRAARLHSEIIEQGLMNETVARNKVLSANTIEGPEAAYLRTWVEKVIRIGNLNYPDEARRRNLSGRLVLEVVVDAWGETQSIRVRHSSGEPVLDQAAVDIVRLAGRFAPFPPALREKYDQFTIVRTWAFLPGGGLDAH